MRLIRWPGGTGRLIDDSTAVQVDGDILELARWATREPGWVAPAAGDVVSLADLDLLAPLPDRVGAVRDFYAFEGHVKTARARRGLEMDPAWYERPVFYFSNPATIVGPGAAVARPPRSVELDFELELAWVVGEDLRDADEETAGAAVVGYTIMNDWSARDIQREEMKLNLGPAKGKDFASSFGPVLVTADEFDPRSGAMRAWVNGRQYSQADLSDCWWTIGQMTAYAAESSVVRPGDVFGSGTCATGCILELSLVHGSEAYPWLEPGDEVVLEIEGIGRLSNRVA